MLPTLSYCCLLHEKYKTNEIYYTVEKIEQQQEKHIMYGIIGFFGKHWMELSLNFGNV